jgi:3-methylcrotonyl-CoA carboxylase alpha subunit
MHIEPPSDASVLRLGGELWVALADTSVRLTYVDPLAPSETSGAAAGKIVAPMPGKVSAVLVQPGATVRRGQTLMVIEAMKMEHAITAPLDGTVESIGFAPGALVEEGVELLKLKGTP